MKEVLKLNDRIAELSKSSLTHNFIYLGRGYSYPVALEGALKLERNSYIHGRLSGRRNEAWAGAFDRCGNAGGGYCYAERIAEKVLSNIQEIKAHGKAG